MNVNVRWETLLYRQLAQEHTRKCLLLSIVFFQRNKYANLYEYMPGSISYPRITFRGYQITMWTLFCFSGWSNRMWLKWRAWRIFSAKTQSCRCKGNNIRTFALSFFQYSRGKYSTTRSTSIRRSVNAEFLGGQSVDSSMAVVIREVWNVPHALWQFVYVCGERLIPKKLVWYASVAVLLRKALPCCAGTQKIPWPS